MQNLRLVIIDDEDILRVSMTDELSEAGFEVQSFSDPVAGLEAVKKTPVDVVITDIRMGSMTGIEVLTQIKAMKPDTVVVLMTAYGSVNTAVEAMKKGAYDYITKPFPVDELYLILDRIKELRNIRQENIRLRSHFETKYSPDAFIGFGEQVQHIRKMIDTVADSSTNVLITGETGTGKELLANIIHYNSDRREKPFIKASCAIFSREVFESELFGHAKGSFTGAVKMRPGRFELADGGTIFLDDIDDTPLDLQVKLLRVLQEHEFERVGGNKTLQVDVRVIAATKADLKNLVKECQFRKDLYFRLKVFPIHLVPLRERREDIPMLVQHFVAEMASQANIEVAPEVLNRLQKYDWPGNVRELKNVVEHMLLLSKDKTINAAVLPSEILHPDVTATESEIGEKPMDEIMAEVEVNILKQALDRSHGSQVRAAELLGIPASTLRTKLVKYGLQQKKEK